MGLLTKCFKFGLIVLLHLYLLIFSAYFYNSPYAKKRLVKKILYLFNFTLRLWQEERFKFCAGIAGSQSSACASQVQ
jgi:hypothetical protein